MNGPPSPALERAIYAALGAISAEEALARINEAGFVVVPRLPLVMGEIPQAMLDHALAAYGGGVNCAPDQKRLRRAIAAAMRFQALHAAPRPATTET